MWAVGLNLTYLKLDRSVNCGRVWLRQLMRLEKCLESSLVMNCLCNMPSGPRTVGGRSYLGHHTNFYAPQVPVTWGITCPTTAPGAHITRRHQSQIARPICINNERPQLHTGVHTSITTHVKRGIHAPNKESTFRRRTLEKLICARRSAQPKKFLAHRP